MYLGWSIFQNFSRTYKIPVLLENSMTFPGFPGLYEPCIYNKSAVIMSNDQKKKPFNPARLQFSQLNWMDSRYNSWDHGHCDCLQWEACVSCFHSSLKMADFPQCTNRDNKVHYVASERHLQFVCYKQFCNIKSGYSETNIF